MARPKAGVSSGPMTPDPRVDAYLAKLPPEHRELLEHLRGVVARVVPDAEETISYGMPAFRRDGRFFMSYAGWKRHCAIYPLTDEFLARHRPELEGYARTKGSLHFTPQRPLPDHLIEDLVRSEVARAETRNRY
jgi:uncharacterized protein YdhG (YjbR/CyaY superfamily)